MISSRDSWIESQAGRLFVRIWSPSRGGSAVPIILFHDSLGSVELWRGFPEALCARTERPVIAYDRTGYGQSAPTSEPLTLDFIAREAETRFAEVLDHFGIQRFIVFGHSVGGGMAIHCAARFSDRCEAVITESAQTFVEERTIQGIEAAREMFKEPGQIDRLRRYHGERTEWVLAAWIDTWLSPAFRSWTLETVLPQVECPVLAIHGSDDEYGSQRHPDLIGQRAGGMTRVEVLADTRHVPHRENESAVLGIISGFLTDQNVKLKEATRELPM